MSAAITFLRDLAEKLQTQDNAYTASPNYCIQENVPIYGVDEDYGGEIGWFNEDGGGKADEKKHKALERYYERYGREPDGWTRCGFKHEWSNTGTAFLTHHAAHEYVRTKKHKHRDEIRVYIESNCYNAEMREVRRLLAGPVAECVMALQSIMRDLPQKRDWLDPTIERHAIAALASLDTAKEPHQ